MRYSTSLIGAAAFATAVAMAGPPAAAQVITFDDFDLFNASTDAEEVAVLDAATAFPAQLDNNCGASQPGSTAVSRGEFTSTAEIAIGFDTNTLTITQDAAGTVGLCVFDDTHIRTVSNTNPNVMDGNTIVGNGEDDYSIVFDTPVSVFGLRLLTNSAADETVTLRDEFDAVIDTIDIDALTATNTRQFVGFYSSTPIKTVEIDTVNGATQNEGIDRLYVGDNFFEILYLVDTGTTGDGMSTIHKVGLDDVSDLAILTPIDTAACAFETVAAGTPGGVPYNGVDMLAGTPDGTQLVFINDTNPGTGTDDEIVRLDLATGDCTELAQVDFGDPNVNDSDQLAYSPGGVLYIGRNNTDEIYTIIPDTGDTTLVGVLTDGATCDTLDLAGSDWTFDHEGDLWVWINNGFRGLYEVTKENLENPDDASICPPAGNVLADFIGNDPTIVGSFTGWATRLNGVGNVVGSKANSDEMKELDSTVVPDGSLVTPFAMVDGALDPFDHVFGDMSNGPLALCGNRTLGYFKTHLNAENRTGRVKDDKLVTSAGVTLCDGETDETILDDFDIVEVLNDAKGSNFSMLSAQLLVATLNCDFANDGEYDGDCNEAGFPLIQAGEDFLCSNVDLLTSEWWNTEFVDNEQQDEANALAGLLDDFNNQVANAGFCELAEDEEEEE